MGDKSEFEIKLERQAASTKVSDIMKKCSAFKIGKTGKTLKERFDEPDYNGVYTHIDPIFAGTREEVSDMESFLIEKYKHYTKNDNERGGAASNKDEMAPNAAEFHVYVVWK